MDRNKAKRLGEWMIEQFKNLPEDLKVVGKTGRGTFTNSNFTLKVEFADVSNDGVVMSKEVVDYNRGCDLYGLKKEWFGEIFQCNGDSFKVSGLSTRSYKRPVIATKVSNGSQYKFTADAVIKSMERRNS